MWDSAYGHKPNEPSIAQAEPDERLFSSLAAVDASYRNLDPSLHQAVVSRSGIIGFWCTLLHFHRYPGDSGNTTILKG
jgi:hypothetical protein